MAGRLVIRGVLILCLVQAAHTGGYSASYGASNGQGPHPNGNVPQRGGRLGSFLIPSKGVGRTLGQQNGHTGYPTKGNGYGAVAGMNKGSGVNRGNQAVLSSRSGSMTNGYGLKAGSSIGQQLKGYTTQNAAYGGQGTRGGNLASLPAGGGAANGYGYKAGTANLQQMREYGVISGPSSRQQPRGGYEAPAGRYVAQGTKGNGYSAPAGAYGGQGNKGYAAQAGGFASYGGQDTKGNGQSLAAGPSSGTLTRQDGQGGHGGNPMKGYNQPPFRPAVGMGYFKGPQPARNQGQAYAGNGYNGYRTKGFNGGYGSAGLGLGPRYGNGAKGPMKGYDGSAGIVNGQGSQLNGRAAVRSPNGNGAMPNGYGNLNKGAAKAAKTEFSNHFNSRGAISKGYGNSRGVAAMPQQGYSNGASPNGYGYNPIGYGAAAGAVKGFGPQINGQGVSRAAAQGGQGPRPEGYGLVNGKGQALRGADVPYGKSLKGGVLPSQQQTAASVKGGIHQQVITPGEVPAAPSATSGFHNQEANDKYQQLHSPVLQNKMYKQTQLNLESNPESAPALPAARYTDRQPGPELAPVGLQDGGQKGTIYGTVPEPRAVLPPGYVAGSAVPEQSSAESDVVFGVDGTGDHQSTRAIKTKAVSGSAESTDNVSPEETQSVAAAERTYVKSQPETGQGNLPDGEPENGRVSVSGGQGAKPAKPDCGPYGQWMKRLKSGYKGNLNIPGVGNGHRAGLGYPHGGKIAQPGYGQGIQPAAGYGHLYGVGNMGLGKAAKLDPVNSFGVVGQPDYATLGQVTPIEQSGGTMQVLFSEAPVISAGIDGKSQLEAQAARFLPNGAPPSGQTLGMASEKSNAKYGGAGLHIGQPVNLDNNGVRNYGYGVNPYVPAGEAKANGKYEGLGVSVREDPMSAQYGQGGILNSGQFLGLGSEGNIPGKYGYETLPYDVQPAGLTPGATSTGPIGSPYHSAPSGFENNGKDVSKYGDREVPYVPQILGFGGEAQNAKYAGAQGVYQTQPLEPATGDMTGMMYDHQTTKTESAGKPYVKGEVPSSAFTVQENVGYIRGNMNLEAPTSSPATEHSHNLPGSFTTDDSMQDLTNADGRTAPESQGEHHVSDHEDEQLPRQIQIQQHLKLHFHPQGEKKFDLNGFFGNSDHQD
ncbi:calymmin isoform X3 [Cyprinodon tularosa]|uniref:calymmin isoform X3 n=1 Tax=Cyprinodon tularosa TaxID=77115 RepID=UPI0018E24E9A|nr:calymmin isoform X3 [Cyprinodon tularosa]